MEHMQETINACTILVPTPERKFHLEDSSKCKNGNTKVGMVRLVQWCALNSSVSGYGPVVRSCEHGNKSSSPLRVEVLLNSQMTRSLSSNNQPLPHKLTSLLSIDGPAETIIYPSVSQRYLLLEWNTRGALCSWRHQAAKLRNTWSFCQLCKQHGYQFE